MVEADGPENLARTTACGVPGFGGASQKSPDDTQASKSLSDKASRIDRGCAQ
jgi:hypothetical protein